MRKSIVSLISIVIITLILSACEKEDVTFDEQLLYGKWRSGTVYYKYISNGSGSTWDTSDDVTEEEAQLFTWSINQSELKHIEILEIGGFVPKVYTLTELTVGSLKYKDDFGKKFSFTKVTN